MAGCTELGRWLALALCGVLASTGSGCATAGLRALGQRTERVAWFRGGWTDGAELWLSYEAEIRDADGAPVCTRERAAVLRIADLDPDLGIPIEEFPLRRLDPDEIPPGARALPLWIARRRGVDVGFLISDLEGAPAGARFRAAALTERSTAAWTWPVFPFALAWDAVAVPFLLVLGVPLFSWAD